MKEKYAFPVVGRGASVAISMVLTGGGAGRASGLDEPGMAISPSVCIDSYRLFCRARKASSLAFSALYLLSASLDVSDALPCLLGVPGRHVPIKLSSGGAADAPPSALAPSLSRSPLTPSSLSSSSLSSSSTISSPSSSLTTGAATPLTMPPYPAMFSCLAGWISTSNFVRRRVVGDTSRASCSSATCSDRLYCDCSRRTASRDGPYSCGAAAAAAEGRSGVDTGGGLLRVCGTDAVMASST